ncbi:MAG: glycoside hydrolase family 9 protein [Hamadaea sp.]|uniref:glycoside hydrolase family 9 protein n=1 Tax=Hamadaea sp. TaxID=2024425 RepID=UPI0017976DD1|nr:glycoside hydrolase family 9 protein [Hamadaea sp.]NUT18583.1 glycoside hydrolase family 9 protein [Hamadaea sp.]
MQVLTSHLGYPAYGPKSAVVLGTPSTAELVGPQTEPLVIGPAEHVDRWHLGPFTRIELPLRLAPGTYRVVADGVESEPFAVAADPFLATLPDVVAYFRAMRSSGEIDAKDRHAELWADPRGSTVDASGGWLDASGDTSKFLSHLTYTSTMSPQQIPLCVWAMLVSYEETGDPALLEEALWGADFLRRFRSTEGYFYTGVFDALTKRLDERFVTAPLADCVRTSRYQAGYRQGGGLAIAALARASTFDAGLLPIAIEAFEHLEAHNREYLFDGEESIVDDYCALLAAAELIGAGHAAAAPAAERRARSLLARHAGWFTVDRRPFHHAAESGLPVLALLRFAAVQPAATWARSGALQAMSALLTGTHNAVNPFGYPRFGAFFFPHVNDTGYWWQGENANIASLAAAAYACAGHDSDNRAELLAFAEDQLAWIAGRNPFDVCMIHGQGRNNAVYSVDFPPKPGGIVNGITSGWTDERDIAFLPPDAPEGDAWRWAEQWIPHSAWYLLAVATGAAFRKDTLAS